MTDKEVIKELTNIVFSLMDGTQHPSTVSYAVKFIDGLNKGFHGHEIPDFHEISVYP
jgi:hypothetical protein